MISRRNRSGNPQVHGARESHCCCQQRCNTPISTITRNIQHPHKCEISNPLQTKFLTTLDSGPTARKLTAEKYNSNTADELARSSTKEHSLAEQPPVTKAILCELDVNRIVHELKLWHDINFDPDLHFNSNLDCGKGEGIHNDSMTSAKQCEPP